MPAQRQAEHGRDLRPGVPVTAVVEPAGVARPVVVGEHDRRPPIRPEDRLPIGDRPGHARGPTSGVSMSLKSNTRWPGVDVARSHGGRAAEQLADRHPAGLLVDDRRISASRSSSSGWSLSLRWSCQDYAPRPPIRRGLSGRSGCLKNDVEDVEPEPVDAAVEPRPDHVESAVADRRVAPVEVGLLRQERVE